VPRGCTRDGSGVRLTLFTHRRKYGQEGNLKAYIGASDNDWFAFPSKLAGIDEVNS